MEYGKVGYNVNRPEQETINRDDILIPGLPDEVAILCIARVSRSYHHNIKAVCQSWRKLLHGRIFSKVRQQLLLAEDWLYLWIPTASDACSEAWYCFDLSLKKWWKLPPMPHDNRIVGESTFASVDGKLFVIGGMLLSVFKEHELMIPCRTVSYFDGRTYRWKKAADLNIARAKCMVGIIEDQMYVFGGFIDGFGNPNVTVEVYDTTMDTWKLVSNLKFPVTMFDSAVMEGKFYAVSSAGESHGIVYDAHTGEWEVMATGLNVGWRNRTTVFNGKLYTVRDDYEAGRVANPNEYGLYRLIRVYNRIEDKWEIVKELSDDGTTLYFVIRAVELVSLGGRLCLLSVHNWFEAENEEDEVSTIKMVTFDVKESSGNVICSMTFQEEFAIEFIDDLHTMPQAVKSCHVIPL